MKNIILNISLLFGLLLFVPAYSAAPLPPESIYLHLDKSFYVTGEIVWYKLYLSNTLKEQPITIRATVANPEGKIIGDDFLKSAGQRGVDGYFKIPFDATTGQYLLQFTVVNKETGETTALSKAIIPIYNDLQPLPQQVKESASEIASSASDISSELKVNITVPKSTFKPRSKVAASIKVTDASGNPVAGNLSITVLDKELLQEGMVTTSTMPAINLFEEKIYVKGQVHDLQGQPLNKDIIGAFSGDDQSIYYARADETGNFSLRLTEFQGEKPIQFIGDTKKVELIEVQLQESLPYKATTAPPYNDRIQEYLTYSRQRKKIFQHYTTLESDLQVETLTNKLAKRKPHQEWNIQEYEYFEFMYIFFKENLSPLRFQFNSDSTYSATMYNPSKRYDKFFSGKPLFIIDNVVTRDADFVARMRMEEVKKVELFFRLKDLNKYFKLFGSSGVVKITTFNPLNKLPVQETTNNVTIRGLQPKATFPAFDPQKVSGLRQPFFRPQVYWNPDVVMDKSGTAAINWHQTDDRSTFLIQVVVQGENGQMGYATQEFRVE